MVKILEGKVIKTNKDQTCWGCAETFDKGTQLLFVRVDEGDHVSNYYWCKVCEITWIEETDENDDFIGMGEVKQFDSWLLNSKLASRTF